MFYGYLETDFINNLIRKNMIKMKVKCPICKEEIEKTTDHIQKCPSCSFYFDLDQVLVKLKKELPKIVKTEVDGSIIQSVDIAAKDLAQHFSYETLKSAKKNGVKKIEVSGYLASKYPNYKNLMDEYVLEAAIYYSRKDRKLTIVSIKQKKFTFCFTGKINGFTRKDLESIVTTNGHRFSSNVTRSVDYLVTDFPNSSTNKIMSARAKGISVISSNVFFNLMWEKK